jgi:hypothetical protein
VQDHDDYKSNKLATSHYTHGGFVVRWHRKMKAQSLRSIADLFIVCSSHEVCEPDEGAHPTPPRALRLGVRLSIALSRMDIARK